MKAVIPNLITPIVRNDGIAAQTMRAWMESVTGFETFFAKRIRVINSLSDFKNQTETAIILDAGYTYVIGDIIETAKGFYATGGFSMTAFSGAHNTLTYTGAGVMFTLDNSVAAVYDIGISCPNGTLINATGVGISIFERSSFFAIKNIGAITGVGFSNLNWSNCTFYLITGTGLVVVDDVQVLSMNRIFWNSTSNTHVAIDITAATITTMELRDFEPLGVSGSIAIKGLPNSVNIAPNDIASIESCNFANSAMTPLSGIQVSDFRFEFSDNGGIQDTISDALIYFNGNVSNTIFSAINTPVKIVATWITERLSKFNHAINGSPESLSERPAVFPVDVVVYAKATTGAAQNVTLYLALNGAIIAGTASTGIVKNTERTRFVIPWQILLNEGDTVSVFLENNTGTTAVLCEQGVLRIR